MECHSACFRPDQSLHQLLCMGFLSKQAGFPEQGKVLLWRVRRSMSVSVHEAFFHFSADHCEKKDEWAQRELLISVLFPWVNYSEIPDSALWIYFFHPLLMWSFSQLTCVDKRD